MRSESNLNFAQYLALVRQRSRSLNGISGIKLHAYQLHYLPRFRGHDADAERLSPARSLRRLFPGARQYIWLTRRDRVRQAISLELAFATNQWWSLEGQPMPDALATGVPAFDPTAIARWESALREYDARWAEYFKANAITPVTLVYEDLVADYEGSIRSILRSLDVPDADAVAIQPARLRRQSDARSETWLAQYQAFLASGAAASLSFPSIDAEDPIEARCRSFRAAIPPVWKRWITHGRSKHLNDDALASVLVSNGYDPAAARAAVEAASFDTASPGLDNLAVTPADSTTQKRVPQP
jgi:LPS sulfotransferase NodH